MKVYIKNFTLGQISYLGKFWFLKYGSKCSRPIRFGGFLNQICLLSKMLKKPDFLHVITNSLKLKVD